MQLVSQMPQLAERFEQVVIEGVHLGIARRSAGSIHQYLHPPQRLDEALIGGKLQVLQDLLDGAANGE
jgi:hypothetical protein